ncbi:MAG: hypothetical protein EOO91_02295 [Pedobacter sp.]|nr:MAG: hypothetical protein EOO91_02295 [Pedobacter sp.]
MRPHNKYKKIGQKLQYPNTYTLLLSRTGNDKAKKGFISLDIDGENAIAVLIPQYTKEKVYGFEWTSNDEKGNPYLLTGDVLIDRKKKRVTVTVANGTSPITSKIVGNPQNVIIPTGLNSDSTQITSVIPTVAPGVAKVLANHFTTENIKLTFYHLSL